MRLLRTSDRAAPALECELPFGEGRRFVHNELTVRGWAESPAGISGVHVEIGPARQAASVSGPGRARFESLVDTSAWSPTTAVLAVTALDREGRSSVQRGELHVEPYAQPATGKDAVAGTGTALHCRPLGPTAPHLPVKVRGWAYSRAGIERVEVFLDGRSRHEAICGLTRPHLQEALGTPDALESGFYLLLEPFACEPGEHVITVVATPNEGQPVGVTRSFVCVSQEGGPRGDAEPSVPDELPPRPSSVSLDTPSAPAAEARRAWVAGLAERRAVLDADRDVDDLSGTLPFESDSFDVVICVERLADANDPERALAELRRVLRPNGLLVASWTHPAALDSLLPELVGPEEVDALQKAAAGWKERALLAEAEAAARLTERAQAQRGEERAFMFLRASEEHRRAAERALERRPLRRLRRYVTRLRGGS